MFNEVTATQPPKSIREFALMKFTDGDVFTDLHIVPGQAAMVRVAAKNWKPALLHKSTEVTVFSQDDVLSFLNTCYGRDEIPPATKGDAMPSWLNELQAEGSIHPGTTLNAILDNEFKTCRVRVSAQAQDMRDVFALVLRNLKEVPESLENLGLPIQVDNMLANSASGLIVVTGPTGAGKSTTLATMVDQINQRECANILTLEDPIEFLHERKKGILNQRELGVDVASFSQGVRDALRFVPDVLMIGEIRDADTMRAALRAAESGHLVLTSLHAPTAFSAVRKMVSYLGDNHADVQALGGCLQGVLAQSLLRGVGEAAKNYLAYELLCPRDSNASAQLSMAISAYVSDSGKKLSEAEVAFRSDDSGIYGLPMLRSVKSLVDKGLVEKTRATGALVDQTDKATILKCK
jgi:pilus retraction protein PilT